MVQDTLEYARERVETLKAQLAEAQELEREVVARRRKSVTATFRFEIRPDDRPYNQVRAASQCRPYFLDGILTNASEMEAVGHDISRLGGGMTYLFNQCAGEIVGPTGGGRVWLGFDREQTIEQERAYRALSVYLVDNPDGGDVTAIVQAYRDATGEA